MSKHASTQTNGSTMTENSATTAPAVDPRLLVREQGIAGYLGEFKRKMRSGDLGSVPVVLGLVLIATIFQMITGKFLTAGNLSNITLYIAGPGLISVGIVFVLLLGEIDLSLGSVAGVSAAISAVLSIQHGVNEYLAIVIAIVCALAIGALHGFFFAKIGVPAFVVTLAGLLAWSGMQGYVMGNTGTLNNIPNGVVANLDNYFFSSVAAAYGLARSASPATWSPRCWAPRAVGTPACRPSRSARSCCARCCSRCSPSAPPTP